MNGSLVGLVKALQCSLGIFDIALREKLFVGFNHVEICANAHLVFKFVENMELFHTQF